MGKPSAGGTPQRRSPAKQRPGPPAAVDGRRPSRPAPYAVESDFADVAYAPHTISAGIALLAGGFATVGALRVGGRLTGPWSGAAAAVWTFLVFGVLHLPDGIMIRPHPVVWRAVLAVAVLYLCLLVFLLFQNAADVLAALGMYDSDLLRQPEAKTYAEDCRLSTPDEPFKFLNTVYDEFLVAHFVGYLVKTLVLRDWRLVTLLSVIFEVVEVSGQHLMPNFRECWFDHLLVDISVCNASGTAFGLLVLRLFKAKEYNWVRMADIPTMRGKARRLLWQILPRSGVDPFQWQMFDSFRRFAQVMFVVLVMSLQEVNTFSIKHMLNMETLHHLVLGRLLLYGVVALQAMREYYEFISNPAVHRLGTTAWVLAAVIFTETAWIGSLAWTGGFFRVPTPANVGVPLCYSAAALALWTLLYFATPARRRLAPAGAAQRAWVLCLDLLWYSVFASVAAMCAMTNADMQWGRAEFCEAMARWGVWGLVPA